MADIKFEIKERIFDFVCRKILGNQFRGKKLEEGFYSV